MEDIQYFIPNNNRYSAYFELKKQFPLFDDEIISALAFEEFRTEDSIKKYKEKEEERKKILLEQIENNKNTVKANGIEYFTPLDCIINKIDYSINDDIEVMINSLSNVNIDVPNEHEHKVTTTES